MIQSHSSVPPARSVIGRIRRARHGADADVAAGLLGGAAGVVGRLATQGLADVFVNGAAALVGQVGRLDALDRARADVAVAGVAGRGVNVVGHGWNSSVGESRGGVCN